MAEGSLLGRLLPLLAQVQPDAASDIGVNLALRIGLLMVIPVTGIIAGVGVQMAQGREDSGPFLLRFTRPEGGATRVASAPWFWVVAFGGFYFLAKRVWLHAVLGLAAALVVGWLAGVLYAPFANRILRTHAVANGWVEAGTGPAES